MHPRHTSHYGWSICCFFIGQTSAHASHTIYTHPVSSGTSSIRTRPTPLGASSIPTRTISTPGIPAIVPQTMPFTTSNITPTSPRIKLSDVQAFVKVHSFPGGNPVPGASAKLIAIDLLTSQEAGQRLHGTDIGLSNSALVYYVEWQGPFNVVNASVPPKVVPKPAAEGVEVFDATTGNALLWWVPNV
jgi:hypothetical protein